MFTRLTAKLLIYYISSKITDILLFIIPNYRGNLAQTYLLTSPDFSRSVDFGLLVERDFRG